MPYSLANSSWNSLEFNSMKSVIKSGFFTMGKHVKEFEDKFSKFHKRKYAVMVNSGSSANLLMIAAQMYVSKNKLKRGDEIIVPAVSWSTTYFPLQQYGLKVVFVDVSKDSFNIDPIKIEKAITKKTKAIFAVNLYGNPCDFTKIKTICKKKKLILFEDNCESLGAEYKGKFSGSFGITSSFSFFFSHHISTMEGGIVLTDDEELYQIMLSLRAHGWTRQLPKKNLITKKKSNDAFYELFNFVLPGYNIRPLELSGAIGKEQLKKIPSLTFARRKNASYFKKMVATLSNVKLQIETEKSSWFCFGILLNNRKKYLEPLRKKNIEFRPIVAGNFTKNPVIKYFDYKIHGKLINANLIHNNGLSFGNSHLDLRKKIDTLHSVLSKKL
jgi:dTDP-4-amino-4,6-dideoxygalactose transaminase|tara:strand:- start:36 stop:1190 length:1155 start_codon:yes stop_codon:yes gene_type:complete